MLNNTTILRTTGIVLICLSIATIGAWFFWLLPGAQRYDSLWHEQFTRKAFWTEIQKRIHRYGWTHDDFGPVGQYGDKGWAEWIMRKAEAGEHIATCGNIGHKDQALKYITGNDPAGGEDWNTEAQWLGWWSTNKEKSQLEWIQAGLRAYGVSALLPPSETDHEPLLALLGNTSTNATEQVPVFVKYNAFRWLRDSGFQVIPFAMSNVTAQTPTLVREGVLVYGNYERLWPQKEGVGILEFAAPAGDANDGSRSFFFQPATQIAGYSLMILPLLVGGVLLVYSYRRGKRKNGNGGGAEEARPSRSKKGVTH